MPPHSGIFTNVPNLGERTVSTITLPPTHGARLHFLVWWGRGSPTCTEPQPQPMPFSLNWNSESGPGLITRHQCSTPATPDFH